MQFRIADSFTKALGKLNAQEQSAAKITVFDMQQDPAAPGLRFHRIDKSKDPNFWSIRSNRDIRVTVYKTGANFLIMACDDDILPLQEGIETVADETELDEVYQTEGHHFYVACTRARDRLLEPALEFFADLSERTEAEA